MAPMPFAQHELDALARLRPAEQIALQLFATRSDEEVGLLLGFDALGDNFQLQCNTATPMLGETTISCP